MESLDYDWELLRIAERDDEMAEKRREEIAVRRKEIEEEIKRIAMGYEREEEEDRAWWRARFAMVAGVLLMIGLLFFAYYS